jgi:hypothetical protein
MTKRIYACYSESHRPLLEQHFLPSIPPGFEVVLRKVPQACETGEYLKAGWGTTMQAKTLMILDAIKRESETFVVSDVDVRFYGLKPQDLACDNDGEADVLFQNDEGMYCPGFMFVYPDSMTEAFFQGVFKTIPKYNSEQAALNYNVIPCFKDTNLKLGFLPKDRFWSKGSTWDGKSPPPANIAVHHANWCSGVSNKLVLLDTVQRLLSESST